MPLAAVVGRAGRVGDQPRARVRLGRGRRAGHPDVLADRQADARRRRPRSVAARCRGRSSAARRRRRSSAAGSCGRRAWTAPSARTARELWAWRCVAAAGGRLGEADQRRDPGRRRARAPRPRAGWPRRSGASGRGPRPGSRARRARGRSPARRPPRAARPIHVGDLGRVAVDVADGGVDLGEGYAHASGLTITAEVSPSRLSERAEAPARVPPMRDRRRHLVGFSVAARCCLPPRRAASASAGLAGGAEPRLTEPEAVHPAAAAPDRKPGGRPTIPTRTATPTRCREAPQSPACGAALLRPLGRRGHRRSEPHRQRRRRRPRLRRAGAGGRRTRPRSRERQARLARAARPTAASAAATARPTSTSPQIGGELFGYAAPDRGQASKEHRIPRHLHGYLVLDNDYAPFEFPGTKPVARPRGDARPRVQPHPPVRLRRLPGRLVRRVDRDLDGGPGLQRHQRLPALRAALGQALGHAADRQLDQGVRLRGLEPVAGAPLRAARSSARPGRGRSTPDPAASPSPPTNRRSAPPAAPTSATTSPASPPTSPSGAPGRASARATSTPTCRARGPAARRAPADPPAQPHDLPAAARPRRRAAARSSSTPPRRGATATGLALVGRIGSERSGRTVTRSTSAAAAASSRVRLADPGRFSRITAVLVNADAERRRLQRPPARLELPDRPGAVRDRGRLVRWLGARLGSDGAAAVAERSLGAAWPGPFRLGGAAAIVSAVAASRSRAKLSRSAIAS